MVYVVANLAAEVANVLEEAGLLQIPKSVVFDTDNMTGTTNTTSTNQTFFEIPKGAFRYRAIVKDLSNANVNGALVRYEKENGEVICQATTNTSGAANAVTRSECDIYTVNAHVVDTPYSSSLRVAIKDPDNLLPDNVWSGTDYNKSTSGINNYGSGASISSSSEWSSIGYYSIKLTRSGSSSFFLYFETSTFSGKTSVTASLDMFNPNIDVVCRLSVGGSNTVLSEITASASDEPQRVTVSATLPEGTTSARLTFLPQAVGTCYLDNIVVK